MEFRVLGPLEVWEAGRSIPLRGARQRALLALLLIRANEVVSSSRLLDELWGAEPPVSGLKALQVRISQLRKVLPGVVETRPPGYVIRLGPGQLDLFRFEELLARARRELAADATSAAATARSALDLWRGPPLEDLASSSLVRGEIRRLEELRLAGVEARIDADLALGRHAELIGELESLVAEHPLRERLREQLMLALYRSGRQSEALAEYQGARTALVEQLGIEPGAGLQRVQKAILLHDPELEWAGSGQDAPDRSILVVVEAKSDLEPLLEVAEPLARSVGPRELLLLGIVPARKAADLRRLNHALEQAQAAVAGRGLRSRAAAFTSAEPGSDIVRFATDTDADLVLLRGEPELLRDGAPTGEIAVVLAEAPCDVAVLAAGHGDDGRPRPNRPVVVPFGGLEHEWTALEVGVWLAHGLGVGIELVGPTAAPAEGRRDGSRLLANAALVVQRFVDVSVDPVLVAPGAQGVLDAAGAGCMLVVGFPDAWRQTGIGVARARLAAESQSPVVLVRRGVRPGGLAPAESLTHYTWSLESARVGSASVGEAVS